MSNILFGYNNVVESATLSGGTWESTLPITNLQTDKLAEVAQTTTDAVITITASFSSVKTVGCVALANHNLSADATIAIAIKNGAGDILYSPVGGDLAPYIDADRNPLLCWFADQNYTVTRSVEITITDTTNPDGYISIGRLFIGALLEPGVNAEYGDANHSRKDLSDTSTSATGVRWHRERQKLRTVSVAFKSLTEAEMLVFDDLMQHDGTTRDVIYAYTRPTYEENAGVLNQDELSYKRTFIGNLSSLDGINSPFYGRYSAQLVIEELAI